jgi:phage gp29-like protein
MRLFGRDITFAKRPDLTEQAQLIARSLANVSKWSNADAEIDPVLDKKGYPVYVSDMMADDQVKRCVQLLKLGVVVGGFDVAPAVGEGEDGYDEAVEIADFLSYCLEDMKGSVDRVLMNIAHAIVPGFSVNELNWKIFDDGPYAGKIGIDSIKTKPAQSFTFDVDEFGHINNLLQNIETVQQPVPLDKVLLYTYDPESTGRPQGVSGLRAAYRHWLKKRALMKWEVVAAEKFAAPTVIGHYPPAFTKQQQRDLLRVCESIVSSPAVIVPEGATIELLETKSSVMAPYEDGIEGANKGIARALLGQLLAVEEGTGGSGSYAQAKVHAGVLAMFLGGVRKEIEEEVLQEQLIKRLVNLNYETEYYPKITLNPPDEKDLEVLANIIDKLINSGVVNPAEPFIREEFGFPPKPAEIIEQEELEKQAQLEAERDRYAMLGGLLPESQPNPKKASSKRDGNLKDSEGDAGDE